MRAFLTETKFNLRLLRRLVWLFFLETFPLSSVANMKLSRHDLFLCRCHVLCYACWNLRSSKFTHNQNSFN